MTLKDLINTALDKKITYDEAITELKKLKLPEDEEESYEIILHKILGNESSINHMKSLSFGAIPNELYFELLSETIKMVRGGLFSPDICQLLYDRYGIGGPLINYFLNEAVSTVRMNTISDSEFVEIGEKYEQIKKNILIMAEGTQSEEDDDETTN